MNRPVQSPLPRVSRASNLSAGRYRRVSKTGTLRTRIQLRQSQTVGPGRRRPVENNPTGPLLWPQKCTAYRRAGHSRRTH